MRYKLLVVVLAIPLLAAACNKANPEVNPTPSPEPIVVPTPTPKPSPEPDPSPVVAPTPEPPPQPITTPTPTPNPAPSVMQKNFSVTANDSAATPDIIMVNKGDKVNLTITLGTQDVYEFGLEFRGGDINSGKILPGSSKTVSFVADATVILQAYWPSSGVVKPASIEIMVH